MNLSEFLDDLEKHNITGYVKYRAMKDFLRAKAWERGIPLMGSFELTPRCNFDCKMCYVHMARSPKELSTDQWKGIFDDACDSGMLYGALTGGECLLRPDFKELYLHLVNRGVMVEILTNGALMSGEVIGLFKEYKPELIQISVYGSNNDVYQAVTGQRAFDKINGIISEIQKAGIMLRLVITPNKLLFDDFSDLYRFVKEKQAEYAVNTSLRQAREETGRDISDCCLSLDECVEICRQRCEIDGHTISLNCEDSSSGRYHNKGVTCSAGRCMFSVRYDGVITPCTNFELCEESLLEKSFADAWAILNHAAVEYANPSECLSCRHIAACKNCPAEHFSAFLKDGICNREVCAYTERMIAEGIINYK